MSLTNFPILSVILCLPLFCAGLLAMISDPKRVQKLTLVVLLVEFFLTVLLACNIDPSAVGFQFTEQEDWIASIGISYHLGVDGISALCLPMTAFISLMMMAFSWNSIQKRSKQFYLLILILQTMIMGIYTSINLIQFFLFWEFVLVPVFFMIQIWGIGPNRGFAAIKYVIYMLAGSAPLLAAFVLLAIHHNDSGAGYSFDLPDLMNLPLSHTLQTEIFILMFVGFAIKAPLFPLHTWLPSVLEQGPIGIGLVMVGVKMGVYGFARFLIPLLPSAAIEWQWLVMAVAMIGVLYGAFAAIAQTNLRRMLAYSSVSHVSLVVMALFSFNAQAMQGAILQMVNLGVISTGLFFMAGSVYARTESTDLSALGGIASRAPLLATAFLVFGLASLGLPGTSGFIGEHLILFGTFQVHWSVAVTAITGVILSAVYLFRFYERAFLGPVTRYPISKMEDLKPNELWIIISAVAILIIMGMAPKPFLAISEKTVETLYEPVLKKSSGQ